jgi:hypothetical protein
MSQFKKEEIICLDLTKISSDKFHKISSNMEIDISMLKAGKDDGIFKLWINIKEKRVVAFSFLSDKSEIHSYISIDSSTKKYFLNLKPTEYKDLPQKEIVIHALDIKNVICINVRMYNSSALKKLAKQLVFEIGEGDSKIIKEIPAGELVDYKINGIVRFWFDKKEGEIVAFEKDPGRYFSTTGKYEPLSKKQTDLLSKMKPVELVKNVSIKSTENIVEANKIKLTLDDILDKISKIGLKSLTKAEKIFLDRFSQ